MSTLMCGIPTCHPLAGRKAQFTGSIVAPLFLHHVSLWNEWFSPSGVSHPSYSLYREDPSYTLRRSVAVRCQREL